MKKFRKIIPWVLVLLLMIMIFYLSHQPVEESKALTNKTKAIIMDILKKIIPGNSVEINIVSHYLRKGAHFLVYFLMGFLVKDGLRNMGIVGWKSIAIAMTICVLYAISDEVHQLFVPGRGGQIRDVVLDGFGSMAGIGVYNIFYNILNRLKTRYR